LLISKAANCNCRLPEVADDDERRQKEEEEEEKLKKQIC
jgi:hypothetical protein